MTHDAGASKSSLPSSERLESLITTLGQAASQGKSGRLSLNPDRGEDSAVLEIASGLAFRFHPSPVDTAPRPTAALNDSFLHAARALEVPGPACGFEETAESLGGNDNASTGPLVSAADLAMGAAALIDDAPFLHDRLRRLLKEAGARLTQPRTPPRNPPFSSLTPQQGFLLSRGDGTLTLQEILDTTSCGELATLQCLFGFFSVGLLVSSLTQGKEPSEPSLSSATTRSPLSALDSFLARTSSGAVSGVTSEKAPARAWPEDQQRERDELAERCRNIPTQDYYTVLGVTQGADAGQVRQAYYRQAKLFHPDRMHRPHLLDLQRDLEIMFATITSAYTVLSGSQPRAEYDKVLSHKTHGRTHDGGSDRLQQAREAYLRGRKSMETGEVFEALRFFEFAVQHDPSRVEYLHHLGVCQGQNPRWRKKAEETLMKAIAMSPGATASMQELMRLYQKGGLDKRAIQTAQELLQWDPGNAEAMQIIRGVKGTPPAATKGLKGIFRK